MDVDFDSESSTQVHEALIRSLQQLVRLGSLEFSELENRELPVPIAPLLIFAYGLLISVFGGSYALQSAGKGTANWITGLVVVMIGAIAAFVGLITFVVLSVRNVRIRALRERAGMKDPGLLETIKSNWHLLRNLAIRRKLRRRRD